MKLRKSRENVVFTGVLGGIGNFFKMDPTVVRVIFILLLFFTPLPMIPLYIVGALIIPTASRNKKETKKSESEDSHSLGPVSEIKEEDWSDF